MPYRYIVGSLTPSFAYSLTAGSQGLTVTSFVLDEVDAGIMFYTLMWVSTPTGTALTPHALDAGAPAALATAVLNPTVSPLAVLGRWSRVGPFSGLDLVEGGPIEIPPGSTLLVEKGSGSTGPNARIYFEE